MNFEEHTLAFHHAFHHAINEWHDVSRDWNIKKNKLLKHSDDDFGHAVLSIYENDFLKTVEELGTIIVDAIAYIAQKHGVRFISIGPHDLICFENVKTAGLPASWRIVQTIDSGGYPRIGAGCGNGPQYQIRFTGMPLWIYGCYDIRNSPTQICGPLSLRTMRRDFVNEVYDPAKYPDLINYFQRASGHIL